MAYPKPYANLAPLPPWSSNILVARLLGDYASDEEEVVDELKDKGECWRLEKPETANPDKPQTLNS